MVDNKVFGWYAMVLTALGVSMLSFNSPYNCAMAHMGFLINCIGCMYWIIYSCIPVKQKPLIIMNAIMLVINLIGVYNN